MQRPLTHVPDTQSSFFAQSTHRPHKHLCFSPHSSSDWQDTLLSRLGHAPTRKTKNALAITVGGIRQKATLHLGSRGVRLASLRLIDERVRVRVREVEEFMCNYLRDCFGIHIVITFILANESTRYARQVDLPLPRRVLGPSRAIPRQRRCCARDDEVRDVVLRSRREPLPTRRPRSVRSERALNLVPSKPAFAATLRFRRLVVDDLAGGVCEVERPSARISVSKADPVLS